MHTKPGTKEDSAAYLTPGITPQMPWRVADVTPLADFQLRVRFLDGTQGIVDMHGLIHSKKAGVFAKLADLEHFNQAFVEHGVATWPGEIDLAPDAMYTEIKKTGQWVL